MRFFRLIAVMIIFFAAIDFAQSKFQVDYNEIKGELTSKDLFKKDFGRYDGYQIELFEGENVNLVVYTKNFQPSLALVDAKGNIFKQSEMNDKGYANIVAAIPSSGNWVLYVIGNEKANGEYTLQTAIAEPGATVFPNDADFCTKLDFLLEHSNAFFMLLENAVEKKEVKRRLKDALDEFFDEDDGSYNAVYYSGDENSKAEIVFKNMSDKVSACLGGWQSKSVNWKTTDDYKEKSITFTEKVNDKPRYVKILIYDMQGSKQKYQNRFEVYVQVYRKR